MLPSGSESKASHARIAGGALAIACATALLASCASTTGESGSAGGGGLFSRDPNRGVVTVAGENTLPTEMFLKQGYCPPVEVRPGTEALVVYERGHEGEPAFIRYQGSIGETARECNALGPDTLSIKVGIAGRLTAGPKGGAGSATLPLRVAVIKQHGGNVLYSEVFNVAVTIVPPRYSADFTHVVEQVTVQLTPADRDLIVYVGFDAGAPKPTG